MACCYDTPRNFFTCLGDTTIKTTMNTACSSCCFRTSPQVDSLSSLKPRKVLSGVQNGSSLTCLAFKFPWLLMSTFRKYPLGVVLVTAEYLCIPSPTHDVCLLGSTIVIRHDCIPCSYHLLRWPGVLGLSDNLTMAGSINAASRTLDSDSSSPVLPSLLSLFTSLPGWTSCYNQ